MAINITGRTDAFVKSGLEIAIDNQEKLEELASIKSSASEIDEGVNLAHPSLNSFITKLNLNQTSLNIYISGDSTGDAFDEWARYFADWLFANYPAYSVIYSFWNEGTQDYNAPSLRGTGSGSNTIYIWNSSVGGSKITHFLEPNRWKVGVESITDTTTRTTTDNIDLIIVNHGHNNNLAPNFFSEINRYMSFLEPLSNLYKTSSWLMFRQNPWQNYGNIERTRIAMEVAKIKNIAVANAWDKFIYAGMGTNLFVDGTDNIHPSAGLGNTGTQLMLDAITEQISKKPTYEVLLSNSIMSKSGKILNSNYDLTSLNESNVPVGFVIEGGTMTKDTTTFIDFKKGYSSKLTATGLVSCGLKLNLTTAQKAYFAGKKVTLAILLKSEASNDDKYIYPAIQSGLGNTFDSNTIPTINGGWHWRFLTHKFSNNLAASWGIIALYLYKVANSTPANLTVNIDRFAIIEGVLPVNCN